MVSAVLGSPAQTGNGYGPAWPAREDGRVKYISGPPSDHFVNERPRRLAILGSTGSIGQSAVKVIKSLPGFFKVEALACARQVKILAEQADLFRPPVLAALDGKAADELARLLPSGYRPRILAGQDGYAEAASLPGVSTVLSAQVGAAGLRATVAAAMAGKVICLANKESLVLAGDLLREICRISGASILPVDSEHNAVFQALAGRPGLSVKRIVLTASGGPFRGFKAEELEKVDCKAALKHPKWSMGPKISIDSATMMNKGLEIIEARHLFGLADDKISVVVHPQSIVHSLAEFTDGSMMAHLGMPDMRMAIAYCLAWPQCRDTGVEPLDLVANSPLTFEKPDDRIFPCLGLARAALESNAGSIVLNAANEAAVSLFLDEKITFTAIPELIAAAMDKRQNHADIFCAPLAGLEPAPELADQILALDNAVRLETVESVVSG